MINLSRMHTSFKLMATSFRHRPMKNLERLMSDSSLRQSYFENLLKLKLDSSIGNLPINEARTSAVYQDHWSAVTSVYDKITLHDDIFDKSINFAFLWGAKATDENLNALVSSISSGGTALLCEDGFLRSADTWANFNAAERYRQGCSMVVDPYGFYFDATRSSLIERWLNNADITLSAKQRIRAKALMERIVTEKLTKYNHQPIYTPSIGREDAPKVLVVDQSYGDFSIRNGWANDNTFQKMLADAIKDNPDADVIVKTHPDTMTGTRKGYYQGVVEKGRVYRMTKPINPYSLLEICDKVYVCSTQFGFEALMAGKEVHTYGMPFYAGWGLTIDAQTNVRRTNKRSLDEVFYMFYIMYTHWFNPDKKHPCEIEEALDWLIKMRTEYNALRNNA